MNNMKVKNVLLAGLSGKTQQWRWDSADEWKDDKTIYDKIVSAHLAINSELYEIRVKPAQTKGEQG